MVINNVTHSSFQSSIYRTQILTDLLLDNLVSQKLLEESLRDQVRATIIAQHCFQHQRGLRRKDSQASGMKRSFSQISRSFSTKSKSGQCKFWTYWCSPQIFTEFRRNSYTYIYTYKCFIPLDLKRCTLFSIGVWQFLYCPLRLFLQLLFV